MIGRVLGLGAPQGIPQMVRQLPTERPLDDRLLKSAHDRVELLGSQRTLADELIQNLRGNGRQRPV